MLAAYSVKRKNEEGFTLIELLIVVIIIGILAAIALPIFIDQQKVAIDASVQSDLRNGVTNVTNAQAQGAGTEATLPQSRDNTKFFLNNVEVADSNTGKAGVQFAVPELGTPYVLAADNAGGKKFATDAFTFTAATGKFTTAAAPAAGNGGNGGGGNTSYPTTLTGAQRSDDGAVVFSSGALNSVSNGSLTASNTTRAPREGDTISFANLPFMGTFTYTTSGQSISSAASDVQIHKADGTLMTATYDNCTASADILNGYDNPDGNYDDPNMGYFYLSCTGGTVDRANQGGNADESFNGGYITFKDDQGRTNRWELPYGVNGFY